MATQLPFRMEVVKTTTDTSAWVTTLPEAASQTFKIGEIVVLVNGYVQEIASNTPDAVLGVAMTAGNNAAAAGSYNTKFAVACPTTIFSGSAGNASGGLVTAVTAVTNEYGIYRDTTNSRVLIDTSVVAAASAVVRIIKVDPVYTVGDTYGRYYFQFLPDLCQLTSTS